MGDGRERSRSSIWGRLAEYTSVRPASDPVIIDRSTRRTRIFLPASLRGGRGEGSDSSRCLRPIPLESTNCEWAAKPVKPHGTSVYIPGGSADVFEVSTGPVFQFVVLQVPYPAGQGRERGLDLGRKMRAA